MSGPGSSKLAAHALRRRYTLQYLIASGLIAATVAVGALQLRQVLDVNYEQTHILAIAGEQRTLSQRLALLTPRVVDAPNDFRRDRALHEMRLTAQRMRDGFAFLTAPRGDGMPAPIQSSPDLIHHYAPAGHGLTEMTESFLSAYERFIDDPVTHRDAIYFHLNSAENALMVRLDQAVSLFAQVANEKLDESKNVHLIGTAASLILVLFVLIFIFRPMATSAARSMADIREALDQRTALLSRSMNVAKFGHWRCTNPNADPIWLSQEFLDLCGMDLKEGEHPLSVIQAGDVLPEGTDISDNEQHVTFKRTWETGRPSTARSRYRKPDGDIIDMLAHMEAEFDDEGRVIGVVGVIRDVTAEAEAERAVRASYDVIERKSQDLIEAQRLGKLATWRMVIGNHAIEWDERGFELMGFAPGAFQLDHAKLRDLVLDDGYGRLRALAKRVIATGRRQNETVRTRSGDGTVIDLYVRATLERDEKGAPFALFGTVQDVSKERNAARELETLAYYDNLTGLGNRALFTRELARISERVKTAHTQAALILLDLDHFKEVNDTLGHEAGDQLLDIVGQRIKRLIKQEGFVARLGGDEFAIVIEGDGLEARLGGLCAQIIDALSEPMHLAMRPVQTNASIGVAFMPIDADEPDALMRHADLALYASKEAGRGRATYYREDLSRQLRSRLALAAEVRSALREERFEAHYQPIIDLQTNRVASFESLLRLPAADKGFIPPSDFIPIAESSHLIAELGAFVLHTACLEAQGWLDAGLAPRMVAVNVSAAQLWHGDLEQIVDSALRRSGLDPSLLCIELTESVFAAERVQELGSILARLKARGIHLALDDFGTGYSSLSYLGQMPFDALKIDRSFMSKADNCPQKRKMLRGIVSLAKGLNLNVTAEGVETRQELAVARDLGCNTVQGWYFGKAMPSAQAVVEAARIEAMTDLIPLNAAVRERRHRDRVMEALLTRTAV